MPRLALLALAALVAAGCAQALRKMSGEEDPDKKWVVAAAGVLFKCPRTQVTAVQDDPYKRLEYLWSVKGCGQEGVCKQLSYTPAVEDWECRHLPLPEWMVAWSESTHGTLVAGEDGFRGVKAAVAELTGCNDEPTAVVLERRQRGGTATFGVHICERQFQCVSSVDRHANVTDETKCTELADSAARSARKLAVERLALETGCPAAKIEVGPGAALGAERALRLNACGKPFVCSTANGRTECRPALDQIAQPSDIPDAGSAGPDAGEP